jgi:predicted thioesterase
MKTLPRIGTLGETQFLVQTEHTIDLAPGTMPPVLSTPSLIWFLEHAAREALQNSLEPDEISVGTEVEITHLAPTPAGHRVTCQARVIRCEGPRVTFQVEARDEQELIARGVHQRAILPAERLGARVRRKPARSVAGG